MNSKKIFIVFLFILSAGTAVAQHASSSATNTANLSLADVVGVDVVSGGGGNGGGNAVEMPIHGVSALANGIESPPLEIKLKSTSAFDVSISASSNTFSYTGPSTSGTNMNVSDVLNVMITENNTGGSISSGFTQYQSVNGTTQKSIITSGQPGERAFSFKYKALPEFNYPAGTYTTDIVYTITKR